MHKPAAAAHPTKRTATGNHGGGQATTASERMATMDLTRIVNTLNEWRRACGLTPIECRDDHAAEAVETLVKNWQRLDREHVALNAELNGIVAARNAEHDRAEAYGVALLDIRNVLQLAGANTYSLDVGLADDVQALIAERDKWRNTAYAASADHAKAMTERSAAEAECNRLRTELEDYRTFAPNVTKDELADARAERDTAQHIADAWRKDAIHAKDNSVMWQCRYEGLEAALRICIEELRK